MVLFNLLLLLALLLACLCTLWHCLAAVVGVCCLSCLAGQSPPEPLWGGGVGFMAQVSWPSIAFLSTTPVIASLPTIRIVTDCGPATLLHNWGRVPKELLIVGSWSLQIGNIYLSEVQLLLWTSRIFVFLSLVAIHKLWAWLWIHKLWPWWRQSWCLQLVQRRLAGSLLRARSFPREGSAPLIDYSFSE